MGGEWWGGGTDREAPSIFCHPESWEKNQPLERTALLFTLIFQQISTPLSPVALDSRPLVLSTAETSRLHVQLRAKEFQVSEGQSIPQPTTQLWSKSHSRSIS